MFARRGLPEPTGSRERRPRIAAQRDRQTLGNWAASAKRRADAQLTPSPPGPTGHRAAPAGGSRLGRSQRLPGAGWWGGSHQEGQSPAWTEHSLLTAPCRNSVRTGIYRLQGGRDRFILCSSTVTVLTGRGGAPLRCGCVSSVTCT